MIDPVDLRGKAGSFKSPRKPEGNMAFLTYYDEHCCLDASYAYSAGDHSAFVLLPEDAFVETAFKGSD